MSIAHAEVSALLRSARYAEAEQLARALVVRDVGDAVALAMLGVALAAQGRHRAATELLRQAAARRPRDPQTHYALGQAQLAAGQRRDAVASLRLALDLRPDHADTARLLAEALTAAGDAAAAVEVAERATRLRPEDPAVLLCLGNAAQAAGQHARAAATFATLCALHPELADAHFNHGNALARLGRLEPAVAAYERALMLAPDHAACLANLGRVRAEQGQTAAAAALYRRALHRAPDNPLAHNNLAGVLLALGDDEAAQHHYERAVGLAPRLAIAWSNLGSLLQSRGQLLAAIDAYDRALALEPAHATFRHNRALAALSLGDWRRGWSDFEARLEIANSPFGAAPAGLPRWNPTEPLAGELLVVAEAGLGDVVQCLRYGRYLEARGIAGVLRVPASLMKLARDSGCFRRVEPLDAPVSPEARAYVPMMSLPGIAHPDDGAWRSPAYLRADPDRLRAWRASVASLEGLRVGLAWQGNPRAETGALRGRSPPLSAYAPLAGVEGVTFVCLQKGAGTEQLRAAEYAGRFVDWGPVIDTGGDAFADTAAILAQLDLLVTSDTAIAHVAGALGVPVWLALHAGADWRWGRDATTTAWYPSMRLYRQSTPGDWGPVFAALRDDLAVWVAASGRST